MLSYILFTFMLSIDAYRKRSKNASVFDVTKSCYVDKYVRTLEQAWQSFDRVLLVNNCSAL